MKDLRYGTLKPGKTERLFFLRVTKLLHDAVVVKTWHCIFVISMELPSTKSRGARYPMMKYRLC